VSTRQRNTPPRTVRLVTLGCARNEVDSEELAGRLEAAGWTLDDGDEPGVVLVNTCGFIEAAKQESIAEILDAASSGARVAVAGCLAERYGAQLADELPEAQVLSFDDYAHIDERLDAVLAGERRPAHQPRDRRTLLPLTPVQRPGAGGGHVPGHGMTGDVAAPGEGAAPNGRGTTQGQAGPQARAVAGARHGTGIADLPDGLAPASGPRPVRRRLDGGPVAPLKIASGCDRRCTFCAIPAFRGAFLSRPPADVIAEARWLAGQGARELLLVSENSTSYGKDLGNLRMLDELLPALAAVPGIARVRVSYLQPAEMRPGLVGVMTSTPGVAPYFDLSFQHASGTVLRSMRRFGDTGRFCALLDQIREACPEAGVRSNFIVGFPGETAADVAELERFLSVARLDAIGIFGYSDEDGTAAAELPGHTDPGEIARRVDDLSDLAEEVMSQRAADRVGHGAEVLIEEVLGDGLYLGRAAHQAPEVDGSTTVRSAGRLAVGDMVRTTVVGSDGVDLIAEAPPAEPTPAKAPAAEAPAAEAPAAGAGADGGKEGGGVSRAAGMTRAAGAAHARTGWPR
jgi:ribosomal protein S12 methylthiotransferase